MSFSAKLFRHYLISSAILSSQTNRSLISLFRQRLTTRGMSSTASSTSWTDFSIAYVTAPNADVAKEIANKAVDSRLTACVNIIPSITSVFRWEGKVETDSEVLMIIKTRTELIDDLTALVKDSHPYEVFELISTPIQNGNKDYMKFLDKEVMKK